MYLAVADRSTLAVPDSDPALSGEAFATLINLSGRRRFTSQRVVLYAVLAAGQHPGAEGVAEQALNLFREAHTTLIKGNGALPGVFGVPLQEAYFGSGKGNATILNFIELADRVLHAIAAGWRRQGQVLLDELVECSTPLLAVLNSITAIYEQEARNHAKKMEQQLHGAMDEIKTISKQAQVVAMNARIVAARAGAAGQEFAVVATELISITTDIDTILQTALAKPA